MRGEGSEASAAETLSGMARVPISERRCGKACRCVHGTRHTVLRFNVDLTQVLRREIAKTEELIPPMEEWTNEQRAEVQAKLEDGSLPIPSNTKYPREEGDKGAAETKREEVPAAAR